MVALKSVKSVKFVRLLTHLSFAQVERPHRVEEGEDVINLVRGDGAALHVLSTPTNGGRL